MRLIKMTNPLRDSLIIWKNILIQRNIMKMNMKFQTLKGGIPILDQPLEFTYEAPTSPHEEVLATSPEQEIQLDDVIERLGRLNLEGNEAPPADHNQDHHRRFLNGPQRHLKVSIQMKLERREREVQKDMKMEEK